MDLLGHFSHAKEVKMQARRTKLYTCWMCSASFEDPAEFLFHIRNCAKARMQSRIEVRSASVAQSQ